VSDPGSEAHRFTLRSMSEERITVPFVVPRATQHKVVRRRRGIYSQYPLQIPDQQRTISCCAASGMTASI
jgi:hypothetical protein